MHCPHRDAERKYRVCRHINARPDDLYCQRFNGSGLSYDLICPLCRATPRSIDAQLTDVCGDCFDKVEDRSRWRVEGGVCGRPETLERAEDLTFEHDMVRLRRPLGADIADFRPLPVATPVFLLALRDGRLLRVDLSSASAELLARVPPDVMDLAAPLTLRVSPKGDFAAVVSTFGSEGVVVDLAAGELAMVLDRGDNHSERSVYPVAFAVRDGRTLLVHATRWNRLDITDPSSGELLTGRTATDEARHRRAPTFDPTPQDERELYLDYFHGELVASPTGAHIADSGWVREPAGIVCTWNTDSWLDNAWESEDGPSKRYLCQRHNFWDGPMCWIDDTTLAVWGYGPDRACLADGVLFFDVATGHALRWFAGPVGVIAFDEYLFCAHDDYGMSVWDVATGERLHLDPGFRPQRYSVFSRRFVATRPDGEFFVVSRMIEGTA